jgi:uncharacterized membrane protein YgaE (UPF0421/DUF939 family)
MRSGPSKKEDRGGRTIQRLLIAATLATLVSAYVFFFIQRVWTLAIPVALALLPLITRRFSKQAARLSAVLMFAWVILGALSIGWFYMPSAIFLALAGWGSRSTTTN